MIDSTSLVIPAFFAGLLTFLAPCTLPLVPAYLGFISGASVADLQNPALKPTIRRRVMINGLLYVLGFSAVFILLGVLFGIGGAALSRYQPILVKIGGVCIILFGVYLMGGLERVSFLQRIFLAEHRFRLPSSLTPGKPLSSLIFGATFAFGWTPCIGPILGSILLLASSTATVGQGAALLTVFSLGLALPFLFMATIIGHASQATQKLSFVLPYVSFVGGLMLVILGVLLLTDSIGIWFAWSYNLFRVFEYDRLLDFL